MIREATDNMDTGISIGGRIINTVRYADDKAVVASDVIKTFFYKTKTLKFFQDQDQA